VQDALFVEMGRGHVPDGHEAAGMTFVTNSSLGRRLADITSENVPARPRCAGQHRVVGLPTTVAVCAVAFESCCRSPMCHVRPHDFGGVHPNVV